MPHRQNHNLFSVVVIESHISALPELDGPIAKFRGQFIDEYSHVSLLFYFQEFIQLSAALPSGFGTIRLTTLQWWTLHRRFRRW